MIQGRFFHKLSNYLNSETFLSLKKWVWLFWLSWPPSKTNTSISYHCKRNYLSRLNWAFNYNADRRSWFSFFLGLEKKPQQLKYCRFISHEGRINGKTCYIFFSVAFKGRVLLGEEEIPLFLQSGMDVLSEMEDFSVSLLLLSSGASKSLGSIFDQTKKDTQAILPHQSQALLWHA